MSNATTGEPDRGRFWRHPIRRLQRRFRQWFESRLPLTDSVTLTQRSVYILPTGPGLMLGATLLLLLVASINYQLNLGYMLTFLLAGTAMVGMLVCHGTLRGVSLHLALPSPVFAGTSALMEVQLQSQRRSTRHGIGLAVMGSGHWAWCNVPAQGVCTLQVAFQPARRGLHRVPTLTAETRYPLGTFRVWTVWRPAAQVLVYPTPEVSAPPLPLASAHAGDGPATQSSVAGDFDGVRAYRRGDPLKMVVWKKLAKADELVSRDSVHALGVELWLDQRETGLSHPERQLSRLCAWVLQADRLALDYGLRLAGLDIPPASGEAQKKRCLQALALNR
ncbi:DUF58 domain-containing protein [Rhodoferax sp. PAMC 29310]|uniref:DUF58 domain-containing protein n=1 Tax=Rhodoferax sp. PAMC 29310 TaxID=2822760 RepID=UPI001B32314F|nr:DUF58 domain-containing protein [Rhodoferax sp. PAMC 29310]